MQSRLGSMIEVAANYALGFGVAWALARFVLPYWGFRPEAAAATQATLLFTVVSVVRSYACRRLFNYLHKRKRGSQC